MKNILVPLVSLLCFSTTAISLPNRHHLGPRDASIVGYKDKVKTIIQETKNDFCLDGKENVQKAWQTILPSSITPAVVNDAFTQMPTIKKDLLAVLGSTAGGVSPGDKEGGVQLEERPKAKTTQRIKEKLKPGGYGEPAWKINSDLTAFRIAVDKFSNIEPIIKQFETDAPEKKWNICERPKYGKDHTEAFFLYTEQTGYVTEVQINHWFAFYVFRRNSDNRVKIKGGQMMNPLKTGFYKEIESFIEHPTEAESENIQKRYAELSKGKEEGSSLWKEGDPTFYKLTFREAVDRVVQQANLKTLPDSQPQSKE